MSFKRPFHELSIDELNQKLRRLIYLFENGEELTDAKLDLYLLLIKRIRQLENRISSSKIRTLEKITLTPQYLHWLPHLKKHPRYGNIRFKISYEGYPSFDFDPELLVIVSRWKLARSEPDCIPLFIGSKMGIIPKFDHFPGFSESSREIAILWKTVLSGSVNGLGIHRITFDENKSDYILEKKIFFENKPININKNQKS